VVSPAENRRLHLIPFLAWHHDFDDMCPTDRCRFPGEAFWSGPWGVLVLCVINYICFYLPEFWRMGTGNPHWDHKFVAAKSLIWNFW